MFIMRWRPLAIAREHFSILERQFFRFLVVGAIGFCVDGGLLTALMLSGWEILPARFVSFLSAVTFTWLLNRLWTFRLRAGERVRSEYASYIATQVIGALINLAVFFSLIKFQPFLRDMPLIPLAFGAGVSLAFNYVASKKYVFKG